MPTFLRSNVDAKGSLVVTPADSSYYSYKSQGSVSDALGLKASLLFLVFLWRSLRLGGHAKCPPHLRVSRPPHGISRRDPIPKPPACRDPRVAAVLAQGPLAWAWPQERDLHNYDPTMYSQFLEVRCLY